jgi:hypothetical protein
VQFSLRELGEGRWEAWGGGARGAWKAPVLGALGGWWDEGVDGVVGALGKRPSLGLGVDGGVKGRRRVGGAWKAPVLGALGGWWGEGATTWWGRLESARPWGLGWMVG